MTVNEAARILGVTPGRVRQLCQAGRIEGAYRLRRAGGLLEWRIPEPLTVRPGRHGPPSKLQQQETAAGVTWVVTGKEVQP